MVLGSEAAGFSGWSCPSSEKPVMTKRTGQPQRGVQGREQVRGTIIMKTAIVIDALCAKHRAKPPSHLILKATVGRNFLHLQVRNPTFR